MAMFVHLAPASRAAHMRRTGLRRLRRAGRALPRGLFAVPVTPDFFISHQWVRELRRRNEGPLVGIYFRIPDEERVFVGHYGASHRWMSASEAGAEFIRASDARGWEVVIPRPVEPDEIHRVRHVPQVIGGRYFPDAKGRKPCTCRFCIRGDYGAQRLRERFGADE